MCSSTYCVKGIINYLIHLCKYRSKPVNRRGVTSLFGCRVVWVNTIRGETPYEGAVAKTVPNLALKPTVMVGKIDVIMAANSFRRCSCLCVYEVRN